MVKKLEEIHSFCDYNIYHYREISSLVRKDLIFYELQVKKTQGMYPLPAWRGEWKISERFFLGAGGGGAQKFFFLGGGCNVGGGGGESRNFEVKTKIA